jgi:conjugal transfer pilus assembly protein TraB
MGDLSSERAYLRGESFSCVREDGGVVDVPLNVYAVGEDGKAGLRGTLVSKQGQAIGKAMLAGIAQSTSQAFSRGGVGAGNTGSVDLNNAAESGLYGGAGSALDRVAQFYIDLAEQIFPVIEISAGREVTLVLVKGAEIRMVRD